VKNPALPLRGDHDPLIKVKLRGERVMVRGWGRNSWGIIFDWRAKVCYTKGVSSEKRINTETFASFELFSEMGDTDTIVKNNNIAEPKLLLWPYNRLAIRDHLGLG